MYKPRLKGSHEFMGQHYGKLLYKNGVRLDELMPNNNYQLKIGRESLSICENIYPEIIEEIKAMSYELHIDYKTFGTFIITAGAFSRDIGCTIFCYRNKNEIFFCRNHDMFSDLKKVTETALIRPNNGFTFVGHGDGLIGKEDGINEHGLAVGMNFIAPKTVKPGLNFFVLIRMILEKCKTVEETIQLIKDIPVCTSHNIVVADKLLNMAVIEMCPERVRIRYPKDNENYMVSTNHFQHSEMAEFDNKPDLDWYSTNTRLETIQNALKNQDKLEIDYFKEILSGKKGMMCQYEKNLNFDTLWSIIYDLKSLSIERVDGNPKRKKYREDSRLNRALGNI